MYAIFMCSKCGKYTFSPVGQKTRLCGNCGSIIKIDPMRAQIVKDPREASLLVRKYNAGKDAKSFLQAVEASQKEWEELLPKESVKIEELIEEEETISSSRIQRLTLLLKENCVKEPASFDQIEELCPKYKLNFEWVKEKLTQLGKEGNIIFPTPWTVKYIGTMDSGYTAVSRASKAQMQLKGASKALTRILNQSKEPLTEKEIIQEMENAGYNPEETLETLKKLHKSGEIIEPRPGYYHTA
jgi:arsenate reductase-like glutaredoxin family protein